MEVIVLASGSSGNSIYIEEGDTKVLIDAGLSGKAVENKLADCNKNPNELTGIIVTHEHRDHVKGVGVLSRRYNLPIYATPGTWKGMENIIGTISYPNQQELLKQGFYLENLFIDPFPVSHDAVEPVGMCLFGEHKKLGIAMDSGVFTAPMRQCLKGCHGLVLESNHDPQMLAESSYPPYLKQRIKSRSGHLANDELADHLPELLDVQVNQLVLGHLSEENNHPHLVYDTVSEIVEEVSHRNGSPISFNVAERNGEMIRFSL